MGAAYLKAPPYQTAPAPDRVFVVGCSGRTRLSPAAAAAVIARRGGTGVAYCCGSCGAIHVGKAATPRSWSPRR